MRMLHSCDWSETVPLHQQRTVSQFKTRRDGSQFTQPVRIFSGTAPRQKADSENQLRVGIATTLPCPGPEPGYQSESRSFLAYLEAVAGVRHHIDITGRAMVGITTYD